MKSIANNTNSVLRVTRVLAVLCLVALGVSTARTDDGEGTDFSGTYVLSFSLGSGNTGRGAAVFNREGTFTGWDNLEEGGMPGVSVKFSPKAGAWKRTGPRSMKIVEISQLYTLDGVPIGIIRQTGAVEFAIGDADHATGTFANEFLGCPTPTTCPNAAEAPAIPPFSSGTFTLTRLQP